jgi:hypothetical protein
VAVNADLGPLLWKVVQRIPVTSGTPDRYGVVADVEGAPEDLDAYFEHTVGDESSGTDRERRDEALLVTWPGTGLRARDLVVVDGERWEVEGEPRTLDADGGVPHHTESPHVRVREGP